MLPDTTSVPGTRWWPGCVSIRTGTGPRAFRAVQTTDTPHLWRVALSSAGPEATEVHCVALWSALALAPVPNPGGPQDLKMHKMLGKQADEEKWR